VNGELGWTPTAAAPYKEACAAKPLASSPRLPEGRRGRAKHGHPQLAGYRGYLHAAFHVLLPAAGREVKAAA